jgi:hypothetical protein
MRVPGVIPLLRKFADREIVQRLFRRVCELVPIIATSKPGDDKQAEAKLARQLEDLLRGIPPNPAVNGILQEIGGRTEAVEIEVVTGIFHTAGRRIDFCRAAKNRTRCRVKATYRYSSR